MARLTLLYGELADVTLYKSSEVIMNEFKSYGRFEQELDLYLDIYHLEISAHMHH